MDYTLLYCRLNWLVELHFENNVVIFLFSLTYLQVRKLMILKRRINSQMSVGRRRDTSSTSTSRFEFNNFDFLFLFSSSVRSCSVGKYGGYRTFSRRYEWRWEALWKFWWLKIFNCLHVKVITNFSFFKNHFAFTYKSSDWFNWHPPICRRK